jgi:sortase (surface protein transpeptidase)
MTSMGGRRRRWLLSAAAVLAAAGLAAVGLGVRDRPSAEPPLTTDPAAESAAPSAAARGSDVLTTGPLMASSPPVRVSIPAIEVADTAIVGLGQQADGTMQVPTDAKTVGWYTRAPTPGALGPAVLAGHVDFHGRPGTFAHLAALRAGDEITIGRRDGSTAVFAVSKVERYAKDRFPSAAVYGPIDHAGLRLITCGGDFDAGAGHYRDNIVVYAALRR